MSRTFGCLQNYFFKVVLLFICIANTSDDFFIVLQVIVLLWLKCRWTSRMQVIISVAYIVASSHIDLPQSLLSFSVFSSRCYFRDQRMLLLILLNLSYSFAIYSYMQTVNGSPILYYMEISTCDSCHPLN